MSVFSLVCRIHCEAAPSFPTRNTVAAATGVVQLATPVESIISDSFGSRRFPVAQKDSVSLRLQQKLLSKISTAQALAPDTMLAAVYNKFGGPIQVQQVLRPTTPVGGVLLQVKAAGICRIDRDGWRGHVEAIQRHGLPFIPGHELSGVVVNVGDEVNRFSAGDRVVVPSVLSCGSCPECTRCRPNLCGRQQRPGFTTSGSFAEFIAVPWADRNLVLVPPGVTHRAAAALGGRVAASWHAVVQQGRLQRGETMAVFGCGDVGLSAIMIGVDLGAKVFAIDTSSAGMFVASI